MVISIVSQKLLNNFYTKLHTQEEANEVKKK